MRKVLVFRRKAGLVAWLRKNFEEIKEMDRMAIQQLIDLQAQVDATSKAIEAGIADIKEQAAKIADLTAQLQAAVANVADPAALQALTDKLKAESDALGAALPQQPAPPAA